MEVIRKDIDQNNAVLTVNIAKADYTEKVAKTLRDYRKKANIPGFRPGMVPMGMIQKMYGKAVLAEEINRLVGDGLFNYIEENKIQYLGEPLSSEKQADIDFNTQEDFEFSFDLGIAPDFKVELNKKDKVAEYDIKISEEMIDNQVKSYTARFGKYEQVETAAPADMLKGELLQLENGKVLETGIKVSDAVLTPEYIKDETQKSLFATAKKGDVVVFNPQKSFENEAEISSLLKISKDEAKTLDSDFQYTIHSITHYTEAEVNQELFDKVYGESTVTSEEEFRAKISENIQVSLTADSNYKLGIDIREMLIKKYDSLTFPDDFLKRWLLEKDKNLTAEKLEEEYPKTIQSLTWQLIKNQISKENDIKVEMEDVETKAREIGRAQFAQYGMYNVDEAILENYVKDMTQKEDYIRNVAERVVEDKVVALVKEQIKLDKKAISIEDFNKMF